MSQLPIWIAVGAVLLLFLFAIQLLATATETLSPTLSAALSRLVAGNASALGIAWLASYALGNGSVIAALALSLFTAGLLTPAQLFLMVAGSRLGAAAIVLFVGVLDYAQKGSLSLGDSLRLGLLAFVLTYTVYLPATVVGYLLVPAIAPLVPLFDATGPGLRSPNYLEPVTVAIVERFGALVVFVLALGLIIASLDLFDRVFDHVDTDWLRSAVFARFDSPWLSFGVGILVTAATTSVAFSLGVIVPLYNRDYLTRAEIVPYVLGANVGTLADTLLVAVVLQSPTAVATVGLLLVLSTVLTVVALAGYRPYYDAVAGLHDRVVASRLAMALALALLVAVPLALVLVR